MKLKHLRILVIVCMLFAIAVITTGCEPNVPEGNNEDNGLDTIANPNDNNNDNDDNDNNDDTALGTDAAGEEGDGILDDNEALSDEFDNGLTDDVGDTDTENLAVAGKTPTAFAVTGKKLSATGNDFSHLPNKKIGWGLGRNVDKDNRPTDAVECNGEYGDLGAVFIGEREPVIYLTFDEGYENGLTGELLDTLESRNAKATFFVTYDYCKTSPELVQRMIDEGHTVGNHSYTHPSFPDCSPEQLRSEIGKLHDYVKETFRYEMNLIRFPMGEFSQRSLAVAQDMGYTTVFWSFAYMDWNVNGQPNPLQSLKKLKDSTHPGEIVLLHAVSKTNAQILGDALDYWQSLGYRLAIIGDAQSVHPL